MTGNEEQVRRAGAALETYTLSEAGWRASPSETLQRVLADLLHWCEATQRDFDRSLALARERYGEERAPQQP
ncbi:hypothetical protein ADK86_15650 [Streptomyces sp. NRRL F-5755]|uniref:hypothetical protein n=1 Tax=Streptomyces sp. NRRL F-5755 TaxID=1519475 RepID=UPI0006AE5C40|nr:hypothetical protein [Streptomyces sp. NRRL F-5755]KOT99062.1 hypothetical protein ADK86_15650 [Streptomyces sp. NRRL F-5755]